MNTQHHESQHRLAIDILRIMRGLRTQQQTQDEVRRKIFIPMGNLTANKISLQRIDRLQAAEYRTKELYNELLQELTTTGQCRCKYPIGQTKEWVCNICGKVDNEVESRNILQPNDHNTETAARLLEELSDVQPPELRMLKVERIMKIFEQK